jgi:hypothetical protein
MRSFYEKALLVALDALGSLAMVITIGMLAILFGAIGAFVGYIYARDLPAPMQYGVVAICALLAPVWLGVWLWRQIIKLDNDTSQSS